MGLDHRISDSGGPFDCAYREDRQTSVARNVAQAICKIPFTLAAQTRDPVGRNIPQDSGRHCQCLQEFQSVQEPGRPGGVVAHLELAQPVYRTWFGHKWFTVYASPMQCLAKRCIGGNVANPEYISGAASTRRRWVNRKAPNAGARSGWIVLAWECPQNGVDHFETVHNIKTNNETGLAGETPVVWIARKPALKTNS